MQELCVPVQGYCHLKLYDSQTEPKNWVSIGLNKNIKITIPIPIKKLTASFKTDSPNTKA